MTISEKLETLSKCCGTDVAAAERLGVSYVTFWRWKTGRVQPAVPYLRLIDLTLDDSCPHTQAGEGGDPSPQSPGRP